MKKLKEKILTIDFTWKKVILFAIITAVYTALINQVPFLEDTSFQNIAITFESWVFFALIIILNCHSPLESALKTFVFFLISQPLIYLIEVPFVGIEVLHYYYNWIIWTLCTFPMAYFAFYLKKGNFFSLLVFLPAIFLLSYLAVGYFKLTYFNFPRHLLSMLFCLFQLLFFTSILFDKKKRIVSYILTILCMILSFFLIFKTDIDFVTNQLLPNNELEINDNWQVSLQNEELGTAYIMNGELYLHVTNHGKSKLQLIDENGYVYNYYIIIKEDETIKMQATD